MNLSGREKKEKEADELIEKDEIEKFKKDILERRRKRDEEEFRKSRTPPPPQPPPEDQPRDSRDEESMHSWESEESDTSNHEEDYQEEKHDMRRFPTKWQMWTLHSCSPHLLIGKNLKESVRKNQ